MLGIICGSLRDVDCHLIFEVKMVKDIFFDICKEMNVNVEAVNDEGRDIYYYKIGGEKALFIGSALCMNEESLFVATLNMGVRVSDDKLNEISSYLLNRNYDYIFAGIYIDPVSRYVIVRCTVMVMGTEDEKAALIKGAMYQTVEIADMEYNNIMKILVV